MRADVSLGTVYRNLDFLAKSGRIKRLEYGGNVGRFDAAVELHYHIRCVDCGRVDDIEKEVASGLEEGLKNRSDC